MKGRRPVILLDMDDVLAHCCRELIRKINEKFQVSLKREEIREFHLEKEVQKFRPEITAEEVSSIIREPRFFRYLDVVEGAQEGIKQLKGLRAEIFIATSTPVCSMSYANPHADKLFWLEENFPNMFTDRDIIFTYQKNLLAGDLLIDDAPHNLTAFPGKAIIFDAPWNRTMSCQPRALNWEELVPLCKTILGL